MELFRQNFFIQVTLQDTYTFTSFVIYLLNVKSRSLAYKQLFKEYGPRNVRTRRDQECYWGITSITKR